jgi:hypothetical protein
MQWCLGLRGSGSTWIYNAVRKVALALAPDRPVLNPYIVRDKDLVSFDDPSRLVIVKSHETDAAAAAELGRRARAIWISVRDPRDCVTSLVQYHGATFDIALRSIEQNARFCSRFASHPRARLLQYEAAFADDPATLDRIATGLGGVLPAADRDRIFAETRRTAIEAFIRQLDILPTAVRPSPGNLVDTVTKWHNHHANRTGESGRWRHILTPSQVGQIEDRLDDWMTDFGYSLDLVA